MTKKVLTKNVKLVGGPLAGREVAVPRSAESYRVGRGVGFWTYNFAGREGRQELFAIVPPSRAAMRLIWWYVGKHGKDPRVESEALKRTPVRGTIDPRGRGAAKRAARRASC